MLSGPKGFTNPRCEWNPRPGGTIRIDMRGPDGVVYPMSGVFQEIVEPERLVFTCSALDEKGDSMFDVHTTAVFRDERGKTALTLQLRVISTTARAPQYLKGMGIGWEQSLERLGAHLAATATAEVIGIVAGERAIVGTRVFDAPREVVWKMWTDPAHVAQWWGPNGFRTTIREMNVKPGGIWRQVMHGPDGRDYHNHLVFIEVSEPERLVYEHRPVEGAEPVSFRTTVTLSAQGERTQVSVEMVFPSTAERDRIAKTYGAVEGLTQHLARLAERLKKA